MASVHSSAAQAADPASHPAQLTISAGVLTNGALDIGDATAQLRRSGPGTQPAFTLFRAESELERVTGGDVRVSIALTRLVAIEVGGSYATPQLAITVSADAEATTTVIAQSTSQYAVDLSGVWQIPGVRLGAHIRPYVIGGGGYLRQLHEDRLLVETGRTVHVGGGVRYWLRGGRPTQLAMGARVEARMVRRTGGIEFDEKSRTHPSLSLLAFVGF